VRPISVSPPGSTAESPAESPADPAADLPGAADPRSGVDLRLLGVAVAAWIGILTGTSLAARRPAPAAGELVAGPGTEPLVLAAGALIVGFGATAVAWRRRTGRDDLGAGRRRTGLAWALVLLATLGCGLVRGSTSRADPLAVLARSGATVRVVGELSAVPTPVRGGFGAPGSVTVTLVVDRIERVRPAAGQPLTDLTLHGVTSLRAGPSWAELPVGEHVRALVRLSPAPSGRGVDAWGRTLGAAAPVSGPDRLHRVVDRFRDGLLASCGRLPQPARGLIPAVVDGDSRNVAASTVSDLRVSSLLHLSAVSGANVTIVLAAVTALLGAARCGRRTTAVFALAVLAGFVLVADSVPSVLRAGVTAALGLLGARQGGRGTGVRILATAATVLVVADPGLARDAGFGLSVLATAAIVLGSARFTDALRCWLPVPVAAAVGVSLAAQLGAQPILGTLSGQLSLVGPVANLLAAPAVAPVTLFGLLAAVLQPVAPWAAVGAAAAALPGAWWLAELAHVCARLPGAAIGWPPGWPGALLAVGVAGVGFRAGPWLLRQRLRALPAIGILVGVVWGPTLPPW
jgi:competence protein ComEC